MKQLFVNAIFSFVTGAFFVLGILLVWNLHEDNKPYKKTIHIDNPDGFVLKEHSIIPGEVNFTVKGKIENTTNIEWLNVYLKVKIYAGDALMSSYCEDNVRNLGANTTQNFNIVCSETAGSKLPDNINYKLSITTSTRY